MPFRLLRYQLFLAVAVALLAVWKAGLDHLDTLTSLSPPSLAARVALLVTYLPLWAVAALGLYALASVLYRVATFGDCPAAATELSKDIAAAKAKLVAAGFAF